MKLRDTLEERFGRFLAIVLMVTLFISGTFFSVAIAVWFDVLLANILGEWAAWIAAVVEFATGIGVIVALMDGWLEEQKNSFR